MGRELGKIEGLDSVREEKTLWEDKKRICGQPISFTRYTITEKRFISKRGLLNTVRNTMEIYRITDIKLTETLFQKMFGVGTIHLYTADANEGNTYIFNIKNPHEVMDLLTQLVEKERKAQRIRMTEISGNYTDVF